MDGMGFSPVLAIWKPWIQSAAFYGSSFAADPHATGNDVKNW